MCIEPRQDIFTDVLEIHNVRSVEDGKYDRHIKKSERKKVFEDNEFEELLMKIQVTDSNLKLDWDDGAGEEWARFSNKKDGIICMISAKIGIAFIRKNYEFDNIKNAMNMLEIVFVDDYSSDDWFVDLVDLKRMIPEMYWHASEGAVNTNSFSLDDFYFATI